MLTTKIDTLYMNPLVITEAYNRIKAYINLTPLLSSDFLNTQLKSKIYFKYEGMQKTGAFKARGALNTLLRLKEQNQLPKSIVAYSSGNHAQAVAWAAQQLGVEATIIIPAIASEIKIATTKSYGAKVIITQERQEAEDLAHELAKTSFLLPPYDHDDVIAGQGTATLEAWMQEGSFDAIFAPCGGGGLISGTYLATQLFSKTTQVYACEPLLANDAAESYRSGNIKRFATSPKTIADGTRTLSVSARTLQYIKKLHGFYEISEEEIIFWSQWIINSLKVNIEPTSALGLAGAVQWIKNGNYNKKILIILSGSNLDQKTHMKLWEKNCLNAIPRIQ